MDKISVSVEKITIKFSKNELLFLTKVLNEVFQGSKMLPYNSLLGISRGEKQSIIDFITFNYEKIKHLNQFADTTDL